jgi:hypothetical protein
LGLFSSFYPVLVIPFCAWAVAQLLKVFINLVEEKHLDLHYLVSTGGMPSAHSALVSSLATAVGVTEGLSSALFAIATIFALTVMYDSAGVRQAVGVQSSILNRLITEVSKGKPTTEQRLREFIGHTPRQVIAGAALGILLAWLLA